MGIQIRAGCVSDLHERVGEWLFVDVGFSAKGRTCGVVEGTGQPQEVTFRDLVNLTTQKAKRNDPKPLNLLLEAPLSVVFDEHGNPTGRSFERRGRGTRYWYSGPAPALIIATGHLLRSLVDSGVQRDVRLFEGFLSFKPRGRKSNHIEDVKELRKAVWNPKQTCIVAPDHIKRHESDRIESAFAFGGMDFGIPPVVCPWPCAR